jgi:hypothetical protein
MAGILIVLFVIASLALRIHYKKRNESQQLPDHAKPSPFSQALQELLATAGGIYLSLILLVSFLQIDIADKWLIYDVKMDPLAFIALLLSIVQPLILRLYHYIKGGA